ncbi:MAG: hypothetical protein F6K36_13820 [Symploca sp. SIO3C6]|uniref:Uncharacterized protein n=1 Tax=Symploca sp. SIO1C4 TaxID=2607765 RepID=A0A6B3N8M2_9CYAN|nr:hypothetical protein [Symploca sp. SIO3C6]NER29469.1 hypothetical protein [Symploca sp. SIO1C4]NET07188.1 hypothetical protein [Symploca sp. SIO2B6]NET53099.1 hypothetical protein [Merismopedia sp. SIO2A8]
MIKHVKYSDQTFQSNFEMHLLSDSRENHSLVELERDCDSLALDSGQLEILPGYSDSSLDSPEGSEFLAESLEITNRQTLSQLLLEELQSARCWQEQTLAEAAAAIQLLLKQLAQNQPTATEEEQQAFVTAAIVPNQREKFLSALQAGWQTMIKEFFEQSYFNLGIAILEKWQKSE